MSAGKQAAKLSQTITFSDISNKTCNDSVFNITVSASSGLPVILTIKAGSVIIDNATISITGAGTVLIEASQPGDAQYNAASSVLKSFEVTSSFFSYNESFIIKADTTHCDDDTLQFTATSIAGIAYKWSGPNNANSNINRLLIPNIDISYTGIYQLKISEAKCIFIDKKFTVNVYPIPIVSIIGVPAKIFTDDSGFEIKTSPQGGILSGNNLVGGYFDPKKATIGLQTITYIYTDINQCTGRTSVNIEVLKESIEDVNIYELITSRQNSRHKTWLIENIENYSDNEVFVFNNWGNLVYTKKGYTNQAGWDASGLPAGTYMYVVKIYDKNKTFQGTLFVDK